MASAVSSNKVRSSAWVVACSTEAERWPGGPKVVVSDCWREPVVAMVMGWYVPPTLSSRPKVQVVAPAPSSAKNVMRELRPAPA